MIRGQAAQDFCLSGIPIVFQENNMSNDFIFRGSVSDIDPGIQELLNREDRRQDSTIILIPIESAHGQFFIEVCYTEEPTE